MSIVPLEALPLEQLRQRRSAKWRTYPEDVLPLFVAETDFPLAPAITEALSRAVELGDTGYTASSSGVGEAYWNRVPAEHHAMLDLFRRHDAAAAAELGLLHVMRSYDDLLADLDRAARPLAGLAR